MGRQADILHRALEKTQSAQLLDDGRGTMAAVVGADGQAELRPLPLAAPGPGELRLALSVAGLCGTDLWKLGAGAAPAGTVLGHEIVGRVEAVGPGVRGFAAGDRVVAAHHVGCLACELCRTGFEPMCAEFRRNLISPGGFATRFLLGARAVEHATFGLPSHLPDEAAVFLEPTACVLRGLRAARLLEDGRTGRGTALILGAGSMGLLHLLVLRALAPELGIAVCDPSAERRELALRLGATGAERPGEAIRRLAAALSDGRGADATFDTVGGAGPLDDALAAGRPGGATVLFAHAAADERADFDLNAFWKSERRLLATYSSGRAEQREAFRLLATGRLDPSALVTHRLPLSRFAEAVGLARRREALKILLTPDRPAPEAAGEPA